MKRPSIIFRAVIFLAATIWAANADAAGVLRLVGPGAVIEKDGYAFFTVVADPPTREHLTAEVRVRGTTATDGQDFQASTSMISLSPNGRNDVALVRLLQDAVAEPEEELILEFVAANPEGLRGYTLPEPLRVRILDDESRNGIGVEVFGGRRLDENGAPTSFEVRLSEASPVDRTVKWELVGRSAVAGEDFIAGAGTLQLPAGVGTASIQVTPVNNSAFEGAEVFDIRLYEPSAGLYVAEEFSQVAVEDDDFGYGFSTLFGNYGVENSPTVMVAINRVGSFPFASTVQVRLEPIDAVPGVDYVDRVYTVEFAPGESQRALEIGLLNDELEDGTRRFRAVLTNPSDGVQIISSEATAEISINDNELGYTLYPANEPWNNPVGNLYEGAGAYAVMQRVGDYVSPSEVTVRFEEAISLNDVPPATAGVDFTPTSVTVRFAAGEKTARVPLPWIDDALVEGSEEVWALHPQRVWSEEPMALGQIRILDNEFNPLPAYAMRPMGLRASSFVKGGADKALAVLVRREDFTFSSTIVRLTANGEMDASFESVTHAGFQQLVAGPDGTLFLLDHPTGGIPNRYRRLRADGTIDPQFAPYEMQRERGVAVGLGGTLFVAQPGEPSHMVRIVKLGPTGLPDASFTAPQINGPVYYMAAAADGGVYVASPFEMTIDGRQTTLIKLRADGSVDPSVHSESFFSGFQLLGDRIYALEGNEWKRLLASGAIDPAFTPIPGSNVRPLLQDAQGRFYQYWPGADFPTQYVRRYLANGVEDPNYFPGTIRFVEEFNPGFGAEEALIVGDSLFISGEFTHVNGTFVSWEEWNSARIDLEPGYPHFQLDPERGPLMEGGIGTFRVLRAGNNFDAQATVRYRVRSGSAVVGEDLAAQEGEITFAAGVSQMEIQLAAINDQLAENDEIFYVDFSLGDGTAAGSSEVTLQSDELGLRITFDPATNRGALIGVGLGRGSAMLETSTNLADWTFAGNLEKDVPFPIYPAAQENNSMRFYRLRR